MYANDTILILQIETVKFDTLTLTVLHDLYHHICISKKIACYYKNMIYLNL